MTTVTGSTPVEVFASLRKAGIRLWREGDQLRYRAEVGALTPELRQLLLEQKSEILEFLKNAEGPELKPPLRTAPRDGTLPLSFAQQRLWFLDQFEPNSAAYNIPMALRLEGALDTGVLQRCLSEVLRRHEALRTCFTGVESQPAQVIQPAASVEIPLVDLEGSPQPEREETAKRLCAEEARRPFDLTRDVLLRAKLFRLGEADHILLLTMHHIASDDWSVGLLNRELGTLYEAFVEGKASPLTELPVQYADFAAWQREWLQGEALQEQLAYWRKQLESAPAMLELPADHLRPAVQSYRGALMVGELPKPLSAALKELSRAEGATLFMTLLAAFQILLHRYSGSDQIVVGSPIAGRRHPKLERLIGFFVNTLTMQGDLSGDPSFRTLLARTREAALGAYAHQDLPFEQLVQELHPVRSVSHAPIFQVLFVLQNAPWEAPTLPGLDVASVPIDIGISKFDLSLAVRERDGLLRTVVEYSTDLFEAETIRRMLGHYQTLLEGIIANPDERLSELPLLTGAERQQLLVERNRTEVAYPRDRCLHELFEEQVERTPDAVAVVFEHKQLSYRQLNERANQLARYLRKLRVGPNTLVGICVERSPELVIGLLGILKAGGAYLPIDSEYPKERVALMLRDAKASVLLTQRQFIEKLGQTGVQTVYVDSDRKLFESQTKQNLRTDVGSHNLAYAIYTSGSTGVPKAAGVYHRGFVNLVRWFVKEFAVAASDSVLLVTSLSFDLTQKNIYAPLVCGGKLHLLAVGLYDPGLILKSIRGNQITLLNCTPSAFYPLIEPARLATFEMIASLRCVFLGGEAISIQRLRPWFESEICHTEVVNTYGPTECADIATSYRLPRSNLENYRFVPLGKPIFNVQLIIVNKDLQLCPIGVRGEVCIAGIGVGAGYINNSELTAAKFIDSPFVELSGRTLYKTGDLARYLPSGNIEYLGRLDYQVKIRGFRIELGEIESTLASLPGVREAVVVPREDGSGDKRLVAYLTLKEGESSKDSELRGRLRTKLPEYMIPSAFVVLDRFPLTPNAKVDRKALPPPPERSSEGSYVAPRTRTEEVLATIWSEFLDLTQVGVHDNFFDLGGHSLLAARVIGKINATFQIKLSVSALFLAPTIETLAPSIEESVGDENGGPRVVALRDGHIGPPIYFIGAGATEYRLAELIGEERAVFAVDLPMAPEWRQAIISGNSKGLPSIEQLGGRFGDIVRAHAGSAPCVLVGYSFWGKIAFEAAQALTGAGGKVECVLLIDASAAKAFYRGWRSVVRGAVHIVGSSKNFRVALQTSCQLLWWLLSRRSPHFFSGELRVVLSKPNVTRLPSGSGLGDDDLHARNGAVGEEYNAVEDPLWSLAPFVENTLNPGTLDARGVVIRVRRPGEESLPGQFLTNCWGELFAHGIEVFHVSGDHLSMVRNKANRLEVARAMSSALDQYRVPMSLESGRQMPQFEVAGHPRDETRLMA